MKNIVNLLIEKQKHYFNYLGYVVLKLKSCVSVDYFDIRDDFSVQFENVWIIFQNQCHFYALPTF